MQLLNEIKPAVIGLGYVGLPLAIAISKKYFVTCFDINQQRISELNQKVDITGEVTNEELCENANCSFVSDESALSDCNFYILTVPTPIDAANNPDLSVLANATKLLSKYIKLGDIIIYESTVYPGVTEDFCSSILELETGLKLNKDFFLGYSPERINPGDREHKVQDILKVTSGSTSEAALLIDAFYKSIITAGTFLASSIRVAEAAKVIENTQRDVNIALMNELSQIFHKMGIDTLEVLNAASTKWNFLPFKPGLVGGHCIGVDPYYIAHAAKKNGFDPAIILAGRHINNGVSHFIANNIIKDLLHKNRVNGEKLKVLIMGVTFKEDCPDCRNTKVVDIIHQLKEFNIEVDIFDPLANANDLRAEYNLELIDPQPEASYDLISICVGHARFKEIGIKNIRAFGKSDCSIYDIKGIFDEDEVDWRL
jgi:UDP-N-acetyl-D-glucosamine/UDP-N-acetyl-D-galactosamine dehydrogenase